MLTLSISTLRQYVVDVNMSCYTLLVKVAKRPKGPKRAVAVPRPYHHGSLRAALLEAAWAVVNDEGVEALTLRECARRAGVSHAAPANHFSNLAELLAELAADGYERLGAVMEKAAVEFPDESLRAAGLGYLRFAATFPQHFRIMSDIGAREKGAVRLQTAAEATKGRLEDALRKTYVGVHHRELSKDELFARAVLAWCSVHGYAVLCAGATASARMPAPDMLLAKLWPALIAP